jgi:hypothetical protein
VEDDVLRSTAWKRKYLGRRMALLLAAAMALTVLPAAAVGDGEDRTVRLEFGLFAQSSGDRVAFVKITPRLKANGQAVRDKRGRALWRGGVLVVSERLCAGGIKGLYFKLKAGGAHGTRVDQAKVKRVTLNGRRTGCPLRRIHSPIVRIHAELRNHETRAKCEINDLLASNPAPRSKSNVGGTFRNLRVAQSHAFSNWRRMLLRMRVRTRSGKRHRISYSVKRINAPPKRETTPCGE